jgi:putative transposase
MDHKKLPIVVLPPRGPAVCPWLTTIVDDGTRALVGWAIALTPHTGTVLTAMRMALTQDPARGPFGGIPAGVRIDRGLEFASGPIKDVFATLCVDANRLPAFMPFRKGKVERIHLTIDQTMLCGLPGYTEGPRDASGVLFGPVSDRLKARAAAPDAGVGPLRIERFVDLFVGWAAWYNMERPHRMLDGRTPAQAWDDDVSPVHQVEPERLRHLLLAETSRVVGKDGIQFNSLAYIAPELHGRGGERVQVRYMPHDARWIEVYLGDVHLCTAFPQGQLPPGEAEKFRAHARDEGKRLSADRRRAAARARVELAPMTGGDIDAAESRLIPADQPAPGAGRRADHALRSRAAADLLGLVDPATPVPEPGRRHPEALRDRAGADLLGLPDPAADAGTEVEPRSYDLLRRRAGTDLLGLTDPTATPPRTD